MPDQRIISTILQLPNVTGYLHCANTDDVVSCHGNVERLAYVVNPLVQTAYLLGQNLGLADLQELQLHGHHVTALCLPFAGGAIAVTLDSRAQLNEVSRLLHHTLHGA